MNIAEAEAILAQIQAIEAGGRERRERFTRLVLRCGRCGDRYGVVYATTPQFAIKCGKRTAGWGWAKGSVSGIDDPRVVEIPLLCRCRTTSIATAELRQMVAAKRRDVTLP